jgi:hypothetical protein
LKKQERAKVYSNINVLGVEGNDGVKFKGGIGSLLLRKFLCLSTMGFDLLLAAAAGPDKGRTSE